MKTRGRGGQADLADRQRVGLTHTAAVRRLSAPGPCLPGGEPPSGGAEKALQDQPEQLRWRDGAQAASFGRADDPTRVRAGSCGPLVSFVGLGPRQFSTSSWPLASTAKRPGLPTTMNSLRNLPHSEKMIETLRLLETSRRVSFPNGGDPPLGMPLMFAFCRPRMV